MTHAKGTMETTRWDEKTWEGQPHDQVDGAKLTKASVGCRFHGDLDGESELEYLMTYREDGFVHFVGMERFHGALDGRSGSYVLMHEGTFAGGVLRSTSTVVPGSGTGELSGLSGTGTFTFDASQDEVTRYTLAYALG